jgi:hypothetical protein
MRDVRQTNRMAYVVNVTEPLIQTLEHFAELPKHQLAGHAANFEFWKGEVDHAIHALDTYDDRFRRLKGAQAAYVKQHGAGIMREQGCFGDVYEKKAPAPPLQKTLREPELRALKSRLENALQRFVTRLKNDQLLPEPEAEPQHGADPKQPFRSP